MRTPLTGRIRLPSLMRRGLPIVMATTISRPLGYLRAVVQAWLFGATAAMDAFVLAFSVPSFLQVILLSGPLSGVLVSTFSAVRSDREALSQLFSSLFTACLLASLSIGLLAGIAAPVLMYLVGPGLAPDIRHLAVFLFRLMLPMLVLQALLSVCKGALNTLDSYGPPEYAQVAFNIIMIGAALLLTPYLGITSLALGASLGALVQVALQFPYLRRHSVYYRPRFDFSAHIKPMLTLLQWAFLSTLVTTFGAQIDRALASTLFPGAISALYYAFLLLMLPASLAVIPLSTVLLTDLAVVYQNGEVINVRRRVASALRMMLLLTVPVVVVGFLLAEPITRLVYERGHFTVEDTIRTAQALQIFLLGLPLYGVMHMLSRCFYAIHDTKTPALVGCVALVVNIVADVILMQFFSHRGIVMGRLAFWLVSACTLYLLFRQRCQQLSSSGTSDPTTTS
ncbi:murein biosynthesis integral membrane protein MurJ [Candidatus Entotheonella serta]|nr:murein biosynthesis integral membrane protein MurJ [Candidatus Entotheonella serta]